MQGWEGFAGVDWDYEGNDNTTAPANTFSVVLSRALCRARLFFLDVLCSFSFFLSVYPLFGLPLLCFCRSCVLSLSAL